ncbi:MAG: hypothetical protein ACSNEK_08880 [Parachlamydiaceae bacterium]
MTSQVSSSSVDPRVTLFVTLESEIQQELDSLKIKKDFFGCTKEKIIQVESAIKRLGQAIAYQCVLSEDHPISKRLYAEKINLDEAMSADLSTFDELLDARFSVWEDDAEREQKSRGFPEGYIIRPSLRQALNISRNNIFNALTSHASHGPLWGKTETLKAIEGRIKQITIE